MVMPADTQYNTYAIRSLDENGKNATLENGWQIWLGDTLPFPVEVGDVLRLYGRGVGYSVRGITVEGKGIIYYMTEQEQKAQAEQEQLDRDAEKQRQFESTVHLREAQRHAMPEPFQKRIERFIEVRGNDWRRDYESYELYTCAHAIRIAEHFKTPHAIQAWKALDYTEQAKVYTDPNFDGSGNQDDAAKFYAEVYLIDPEMLVHIHGAMHAIVGCEKYGCYAATVGESAL